jgi:TatD DNase family protein
MASDAHAHPFYLSKVYGNAEAERRKLSIMCAGSAWNNEDFLYNEKAAGYFPMALCFAVHPQLSAFSTFNADSKDIQHSLSLLYQLAGENRIDAVGETGFDLFNDEFRAAEKMQDDLFEHHLCTAEKYELPLVLHLRRAMQKIFLHTRRLKKIPAVVFHSYPGTADEATALLRRGVNAYFSFGTTILLNHKTAMKACAAIDEERLLFETDAPYQSPRGRQFSTYADIADVINKAAELRGGAGKPGAADELERVSDENFYKVYKKRLK